MSTIGKYRVASVVISFKRSKKILFKLLDIFIEEA